jgi:predicted Zn-dependent protease
MLSAEDESAADELSVSLLRNAGYDPLATLSALRRLSRGSDPTAAPQIERRERSLAAKLAELPLEPARRRNDRLFRRIQAELLGLEPSQPLRDGDLR